MKDSIYFLKTMIKDFEEASLYFKDYLNTNSHDSWGLYNMRSLGWVGFSQIIDRELMSPEFSPKLREIKDYAYTQYNFSEFVAGKEHKTNDVIKTLEILSNLKKEIEILLKSEIKRAILEDRPSRRVA